MKFIGSTRTGAATQQRASELARRGVATFASPVAGGQYEADQNEDGTWNIRGVPIFAAHERYGNEFNEAWIAQALATATAQYQQGSYLPPLHVSHNTPSTATIVERAGFFLPTHVESRTFGGRSEPVAVVVADLLAVPPQVYDRIRAGELPYCSVEVPRDNFDVEKAEIKSVALLDRCAPFFPFPNITVGREKAKPTSDLVASAPVVACYSASGGSVALFQFGDPMKPKAKTPAKAPKTAAYMAEEVDAVKSATVDAFKAAQEKLAAMMEGLAKLGEDLGIGGGDGEAEAPAEGEQAAADGPAEAPEEEKKDEPKKMAASAVGEGAAFYAAELARIEAGFNGRLAAIERGAAEAKKTKSLEQAVDTALGELAAYGASDPVRRTELRKELMGYATKGGAPAVAAYVAATKAHGVETPPESFSGELGAGDEVEPEEVAAYSAQGGEAHKEARAAWRTWKRTNSRRPLDEFLAANVDPAGFMDATRTRKTGKGKK